MSELMQSIAQFLNVNVNEIRSDRKHPQYRIRTSTIKTNLILCNYLNQFKLQGIKFKDFEDFKKAALIIKDKTHLTREGLDEVKKIKGRMNKNRKIL